NNPIRTVSIVPMICRLDIIAYPQIHSTKDAKYFTLLSHSIQRRRKSVTCARDIGTSVIRLWDPKR
ncbi:MAG: hypothetical protein ACYTF1_09425, partial [Planctomycetota bacterium]